MYKAYLNLINNSCTTIAISGNLTGYDNLETQIEKIFGDKLKTNVDYKTIITNKERIENTKPIEQVKEFLDTNQSVITFAMRAKDVDTKDFFALNVYNEILGGNASSKLFQNLRERDSLAYIVKSRYYRYKNIFVIVAGIESKNYEKAKEVIIEQLDSILKGEITEKIFDSTKDSLIADLLEWKDSKIAIEKLLISNLMFYKNNTVTLDRMIEGIKAVTIKDVIDIAKKVEVEKIYLLGGETNV